MEFEVTSSLPTGTVVWGRVRGYPWWPGLTVPYENVLFMRPDADFVPVPNENKLIVQWFTDGRLSMLSPSDVRLYDGNPALRPPRNSTYEAHITAAMAAADSWLTCARNRQEAQRKKRSQGEDANLTRLRSATQSLVAELPNHPILKRCARKAARVIENALKGIEGKAASTCPETDAEEQSHIQGRNAHSNNQMQQQ